MEDATTPALDEALAAKVARVHHSLMSTRWTLGELEPSTMPHKMRRYYEHTSKELTFGGKSVQEAQRLLLEERAELLSESVAEEVLALDHDNAIVTVAQLAALAANTNGPLSVPGEGTSSPKSSAAEVLEMSEEMQAKLEDKLCAWRKDVGLKQECDVWSKGWYEAKVIDMAEKGPTLKIKFLGFKNDDAWIEPVSNAEQSADHAKQAVALAAKAAFRTTEDADDAIDRDREAEEDAPARSALYPRGTYTATIKPKPRKEPAKPIAPAPVVAPPVMEMVTNRYGRLVPKKAEAPKKPPKKARSLVYTNTHNVAGAAGGSGGDGMADGDANGSEGAGTSRADGAKYEQDLNDWYCSSCMAFEREDAEEEDVLLACDGPCLRSFHLGCIGLPEAPTDETWLCDECTEKEHTCFICGDTGVDDDENGGVFKCSHQKCGRFFHLSCIENHDLSGNFQFNNPAKPTSFLCGAHFCDTCRVSTTSRGPLNKCHTCPRAYHENCVAPNADMHDYCLVCPTCVKQGHVLPPIALEGQKALDGMCTGITMSGDRLNPERVFHMATKEIPPPMPPTAKKSDYRHYRLPMDVLKEVEKMPPPFTVIKCNQYNVLPYTVEKDDECAQGPCSCVGVCTDRCENRLLNIECFGQGDGLAAAVTLAEGEGTGSKGMTTEAVCKPVAKGEAKGAAKGLVKRSVDKWTICKNGPDCGNRAIQKRGVVKVQPFIQEGMGWGLKTLEAVKAGTLIREYMGEVVDDEILAERMHSHSKHRPGDNNHYVMELTTGLYLDARQKGNVSRFINHSCGPNCELQKWLIKGETRIGIFAIKDIPEGGALSYDYQFNTKEASTFICKCGAPNCRGSLSSEGYVDPNAKVVEKKRKRLGRKEKKELLKKAKLQLKQKADAAETNARKRHKQLSLTSDRLPGDPNQNLRAGPQRKYYEFAQERGLFLVRNLANGTMMLDRQRLLEQRVQKAAAAAATTAAENGGTSKRSVAKSEGTNTKRARAGKRR